MSNSNIFDICQQLQQEGKEPSVALIKGRLRQRLPLPSIIAGLKQWKSNPEMKQVEAQQEVVEEELSLEKRVEILESIVAELKAEIATLKK